MKKLLRKYFKTFRWFNHYRYLIYPSDIITGILSLPVAILYAPFYLIHKLLDFIANWLAKD